MDSELNNTIVIVEDDPAIRDVLQIILENAGYTTMFYIDGEAFLKSNSGLAALYILDKQLPGIDGLDICKHLQSQSTSKNIPIIVLSASLSVKEASKLAGASAFLEKPFKIEELLFHIRSFMVPSS